MQNFPPPTLAQWKTSPPSPRRTSPPLCFSPLRSFDVVVILLLSLAMENPEIHFFWALIFSLLCPPLLSFQVFPLVILPFSTPFHFHGTLDLFFCLLLSHPVRLEMNFPFLIWTFFPFSDSCIIRIFPVSYSTLSLNVPEGIPPPPPPTPKKVLFHHAFVSPPSQ